jgi:Tfp pilus assembly protein PilF
MDRLEKLKEFLLADPHDAFVKHAMALEYVKIGDEATARRLWEEVLERDPAYVGSY